MLRGRGVIVLATVICVIFCAKSFAQDIDLERIVVMPSRIEEPIRASGSSVSVISNKRLEQQSIFTIGQSLKQITGLNVAGTGGLGTTTSVFLRGASAGQTRVMIDGVKIYDPSSTNASYDFAHLNTDNVERIEVLKGSQSSLYGSDAIGGVINIITKKGLGRPKISLSSEGGSFYTWRQALGLGGQKDKLHYSLAVTRLDTEGFSKAKEKNNNPENDAYQNTSASLRLDYDINPDLAIGLINRYLHTRTEGDDYDFFADRPVDDIDRMNFNDEGVSSVLVDHRLSDLYKHRLQASYTRNYRQGRDDTDEYERDWYDGKTYQLDWQAELDTFDFVKTVFGANYLREKADTYYFHNVYGETDVPKSSSNTKGAFIENKFNFFADLYLNAVYRIDDHSDFKDHDTYRFDASYLIRKTDTRLKGMFGTGYKSPSLYQLNAPPMFGLPTGNLNLKPEESESYEIGIDQGLFKEMIRADVTYFHTQYASLIDFVFGSGYVNLSKARAYGVESSIKYKKDYFGVTAGYTWLDTENKNNGDEFLKRPKNKANLQLDLDFSRWGLNFGVGYVGHSNDYKNKLLKSHCVANLSMDFRISKAISLFGRIENMFDEEYEESKGYQTDPFSLYGGIKAQF